MQLEDRKCFFSIGISSRDSRCLCFAVFMNAQIGQMEKTKGPFSVYEKYVVHKRGKVKKLTEKWLLNMHVYVRYTLNTLHLKTDIIPFSSKVTLKHILDLILRNVHCAQVACRIKFNYNLISVRFELSVSKYVNRFELY